MSHDRNSMRPVWSAVLCVFRFCAVARAVAVLAFLVMAGPAWAAPANDKLSNAVTLVPTAQGVTVTSNNFLGTVEPGEFCPGDMGSPARSVWYRIAAPAGNKRIVADTSGSDFDTKISVYRGTAAGGVTALVGVTGASSGGAAYCGVVGFDIPAGNTSDYLIAVDGDGGDMGHFLLNVSTGSTVTNNDFFVGASVLSFGSSGMARAWPDSSSATVESGEFSPSGLPAPQRSRWYRIPAPAQGKPFTVIAKGYDNINLDTFVSVYRGNATGSVASLTPVTGNDNWGANVWSRTNFVVGAGGQDYFIAVNGKSGITGEIDLKVYTSPHNDALADADTLGFFQGKCQESYTTNHSATAEPGEYSGDGEVFIPTRTVWYRIVAPAAGTRFMFDTEGSNFDTTLSVYWGSGAGGVTQLEPVTADDDGGPDHTSRVSFTVTGDGTHDYFVALGGYEGDSGDIVLTGYAAPKNDDLAAAMVLSTADGYAGDDSSNYIATQEGGEFSAPGWGSPSRSVWYRIPAPVGGMVMGVSVSSFDFNTKVSIYRGSPTSGVGQLEAVTGNSNWVTFVVPQSNAMDYFIAVDTADGRTGEFRMSLSTSPANDLLAGAQVLVLPDEGITVEADNALATKEAGEHFPSGPDFWEPDKSLWYRLPVPAGGSWYEVETEGSSLNAVLTVYRGTAAGGVGNLEVVAGDEMFGIGYNAHLSFSVSPANTQDYFISVSGAFGDTGAFKLKVMGTPSHDFFSHARTLSGHGSFKAVTWRSSAETGEPSVPGMPAASKSVWYRIPAPAAGTSFILTCTESNYDIMMSVFRGPPGGGFAQLVPVAGDRYGPVSFVVPAGSTQDYYISIDSYWGEFGDATFYLSATPQVSTVAGSAAGVFPATSPHPVERFGGGADAFDLDGHSVLFVPYQVQVGGFPETHYRYTTARIRELPEDLTKVKPMGMLTTGALPAGFRIFGEVATAVELGDDEDDDEDEEAAIIRFRNGGNEVMIPRVWALSGLNVYNSINLTRVKAGPGKTTVEFDYGLGRSVESGNGGHEGLCQVELFANGWIRISYLGTTFTEGTVGLFNGYEPVGERDFSAAKLVMKDVVVAENAGSAVVQVVRPAAVATALDLRVEAIGGSAIAGADFSVPAAVAVIPAGTATGSVTIPLIADAMAESEEYFTLRVTAAGQPEWVLGEARVWITDATAAQPGVAPRMSLAGKRLKITPPGGSTAGITGFRIVSIEGGTLSLPGSGAVVAPGSVISLATGAAGLIASSPGIKVKMEAITGAGTALGSMTMDLDGKSSGPVFGFARQIVDVKEGEIAQLVVTSSVLEPGATVACEVATVTSGAAADAADYSFRRQTLQFREGRASISIPILADGMREGTNGVEEFEVMLVNPSPGAVVGPASVARVRITDAVGPMRPPLTQRFVARMPTGKSVRLALSPADFAEDDLSKAWRFIGETTWRASGSNAWNVRKGLHRVQFRAPAGIAVEPHDEADPEFWQGFDLFMAPPFYLNQGMSSGLFALDVAYQDFFPGMYVLPEDEEDDDFVFVMPSDGTLAVTFNPSTPSGRRWRLLGEGDTEWRTAGTVVTVQEGKHLIEFKDDLTGFMAPGLRPVEVRAGELTSVTAAYRTRPGTAALPTVVADASLRTSTTSLPDFQAIPIQEQRGTFSVSFEFSPKANSSGELDTLVGLSANKVTSFSQMSAVMRTHSDEGHFEGWNGALTETVKFTAAEPMLTYESDEWYFVEFLVDVAGANYDLVVTPPDGPAVTVLKSANFRVTSSGAAPASELRYLITHSEDGSARMRNLRVEPWTPTRPTWWTREFPAQTGAFELGLTVNGLYSADDGVGELGVKLGLSDGKVAPDVELDEIDIEIPIPEDGPYISRAALSLQVDLVNHTYTVSNLNGVESVRGTLPASFTRTDRLHLQGGYFRGHVRDAMIEISPPAYAVAPSGDDEDDYVPTNWLHIPIEPQGETSRFSFECDVTTHGETVGAGDLINSIVGLGDARVTIADGWPNVPVTLRARLSSAGVGVWDAHTGGSGSSTFSAVGSAPVVDGRSYHLKFVVDMTTRRFRATVQPENGPPVVMTGDAPFRKSGVTEIRYLILRNVQGRLAVSNIRGPLPHPDDAPVAFTGQIESDVGFGSGVVVADHAVLTTARLVFDPVKLAFVPKVAWRLPGGGGSAVPDMNEPASILLLTGYAPVLLGAGTGQAADEVDLAVLAFRPMTLPDHDNAPGQGGYSGFAVDPGTNAWAGSGQTRVLMSFPMAGVAKADHGRLHRRDVSSTTFSALSPASAVLRQVASGLEVPPGSEGAPVFVRQGDLSYVPAAICVGGAAGQPRFRTIDETVASAIYQANEFQRQPSTSQEMIKGGVYYIESKLASTLEANRGHIFSDALPKEATWWLSNSRFSDPPLVSSGGQAVSVPAADYRVTLKKPPAGFMFNDEEVEFLVDDDPYNGTDDPEERELQSWVGVGDAWHLPQVYVRKPAETYSSWVATYFRDAEQGDLTVTGRESRETFLGVENSIAYAFGFDPREPFTRACDPEGLKPGYPVVRRRADGRTYLEFLRRKDANMNYVVGCCESVNGTWAWPLNAGWPQATAQIVAGAEDATGNWQHVRIPLDTLGLGPARGFVRVRVEFDE